MPTLLIWIDRSMLNAFCLGKVGSGQWAVGSGQWAVGESSITYCGYTPMLKMPGLMMSAKDALLAQTILGVHRIIDTNEMTLKS